MFIFIIRRLFVYLLLLLRPISLSLSLEKKNGVNVKERFAVAVLSSY